MPNRPLHQRRTRSWGARRLLISAAVVVILGAGLGSGLVAAFRSTTRGHRSAASSDECRIGATASSCGLHVPKWSLIATLPGSALAYARPSASSPSFPVLSSWPSANSFPVIATAAGGWLEIRLIARPNGQTGWISSSSCTLTRTSDHVVVDLSRRQLLLFKEGRLAFRAAADVGAPDSPTPPGQYFVALFAQAPSAVYGPFVIVTSAFADQETDWEQQGQPVVAISAPQAAQSTIESSGAATTQGGVALTTTDLEQLRSVPAGTQLDVVTTLAPSSSIAVQRVSGTDAIATAVAASHIAFPAYWSAKAVVLARSDFFSDALAGGPLAQKVGGPLLLTPGASSSAGLDPRVQSEIQRVLAPGGTVYILGGTGAMSMGIDTTLEGLGYATQRIAGADEYATAVAVAEQMGNPKTVFEATGLSYQDAACAVPAAIAKGGAILLTDGPVQSPETSSYLAFHQTDVRYAIGGKLAASGADPGALPVYGSDAYKTCAAVARRFFPKPTIFGAASVSSFTDALSGSAFIGALGAEGPMLLVPPSGALPSSTKYYLSAASGSLWQGYLFGGQLAVGDRVLSQLESAGGRGSNGHG